AASSVVPSRGSSTTWLTTCPRKCGPSSFQSFRPGSLVKRNAPFFVATKSVTLPPAPFAALARGGGAPAFARTPAAAFVVFGTDFFVAIAVPPEPHRGVLLPLATSGVIQGGRGFRSQGPGPVGLS